MPDDLDYWQARFEHYDDAARRMIDRIVQLAVVMLTLTLTIAGAFLAGSHPEALFAVPAAILTLWVIVIRLFSEQDYLVMYRAYAEGRAAQTLGDPEPTRFLQWEAYAGNKLNGTESNPSGVRNATLRDRLMFGVLAMISVALLALCFWLLFALLPALTLWTSIELGFVALVGIISIFALRTNGRESKAGLAAVRNDLDAHAHSITAASSTPDTQA